MIKLIDDGIDRFSKYLTNRNDLDHITYLKLKLGIQTLINNILKGIVVYSISIFSGLFFYTLTVHLSFVLIKTFAHGAHAKSALQCHLLNFCLFIVMPWLIVYNNINYAILLAFSALSFIFLSLYAPAATLKQPVPSSKRKSKKLISLILAILLIFLSINLNEPFNKLILLGIIFIGFSQLPIFLTKEEN
ncbi:accessory gene regulator AgrB [Staphylococcus sp. SQ8-PEA]|uniref:Accessory gene regulator protein B n=1 Tax=Staphylococcus marylandisciuri TaxID=2981529 RepID=A0ABT2QQD1_9STAP|nr:accessory gene regulator AgrB [Staphylococcus marylandisciuri]MCU5746162.1 accessory gene regulator AgrB [Staphylococcus marylandisciuri]